MDYQYTVSSKHATLNITTVQLLLVLAYSIVICIPLPVLTYRTRKIEHGHYKDTKKINGFLLFLLFGSALVSLWGIFRNVGWYEASISTSSAGYTVVPVMCQVFLIIHLAYRALNRGIDS